MICAIARLRVCVNPPIGEALSADAFQSFDSARGIVPTEFSAMVIAEIELGNVAIMEDQQ